MLLDVDERDAPDGLLPIGRISRTSSLSPRQLRHYHQLGILPPARVDEDSGRRFYSRAQAETAKLIALLRSVDMPLGDIRRLIAHPAPEDARAIFERHRRRVAVRLDQAGRMLATIDRMLQEDVMEIRQKPPYAFELFTPSAQAALVAAQGSADADDRRYIDTSDLLVGLAESAAGHAAAALAELGIDAGAIRSAAAGLPRPGRPEAPPAVVPTDRVRTVVDIAVNRERLSEGSELVDTGHLLLGILAEGAGVGARVLDGLGASEVRVRAALERARAERGPEDAVS